MSSLLKDPKNSLRERPSEEPGDRHRMRKKGTNKVFFAMAKLKCGTFFWVNSNNRRNSAVGDYRVASLVWPGLRPGLKKQPTGICVTLNLSPVPRQTLSLSPSQAGSDVRWTRSAAGPQTAALNCHLHKDLPRFSSIYAQYVSKQLSSQGLF